MGDREGECKRKKCISKAAKRFTVHLKKKTCQPANSNLLSVCWVKHIRFDTVGRTDLCHQPAVFTCKQHTQVKHWKNTFYKPIQKQTWILRWILFNILATVSAERPLGREIKEGTRKRIRTSFRQSLRISFEVRSSCWRKEKQSRK